MLKVGVFAIILNQKKKVLLLHRRDHFDIWELPGGGLEEGEAPWDGVIWETKEEVCLDVAVKKLSGVYYKPIKNEITFAFICEIINGTPSVSREADAVQWFAFQDIPKNISLKQLERIQDALENAKEPFLKIQSAPSSVEQYRKDTPV